MKHTMLDIFGEIIETEFTPPGEVEVKKLKDLEVDDEFFVMSDKRQKVKWKVLDKCGFNRQAGSPTRRCLNLKTNEVKNKLCRRELQFVKHG